MSYEEALSRLAAASHRGMRLGLETTSELLAALDHPERELRGVLVAGTNGKGSVCAMVAAIGQRTGLKVALLTKPHLTSYRERIRLGGDPVSEERFEELVDQVITAESAMDCSAGLPTHHELLTAMGFLAAAEYGAALTVCEVGLGGRLDATNVWDAGVAVVVTVGLDHQAHLGNTVAKIAGEKAAIIKPGNLAVTGAVGEAAPVVREAARRAGVRLWQLGAEVGYRELVSADGCGRLDVRTPKRQLRELAVGLGGGIQLANAAISTAVADCLIDQGLPITEAHIRQGLRGVVWSGRLEPVASEPVVIVDSAHNPHAVAAVLPDLRLRIAGRPAVLLFGSMGDHDHQGMLELLATIPFAEAVFTRAESPRAVEPTSLLAEWPGAGRIVFPVGDALEAARAAVGPPGVVVALGSIYVIGEVLAHLKIGLPPDPVVVGQPWW
ncbi:MAG: bifunctional folylpolyglutamate synthase/dihydrofolate synthase [Candidatus Dormibacteria bacterium]